MFEKYFKIDKSTIEGLTEYQVKIYFKGQSFNIGVPWESEADAKWYIDMACLMFKNIYRDINND